MADTGKNTFSEEDEKLSTGDSSGVATLGKEKCLGGVKTSPKVPIGRVTSSSPNANKTKNSVMNLDNQPLGKSERYIFSFYEIIQSVI